MSLPQFTLFEHRLEEKYNELLKKLPGVVKELRLSNSIKDGDLQRIKKGVFQQLWSTWETIDFEVKDAGISVQNQEYEFEESIAKDILGVKLSSPIVNGYITLYYAIYTIPYSGSTDSLKYTTIYPSEKVYMVDHEAYLALTIYADRPIEIAADQIKAEKDRLLDMFKKNQDASEKYINTKEDTFKDAIDKEIDFNFKSGRDEISDNSLLL